MSEKRSVTEDKEPMLAMEDRLKGIAYQFVTLYDRWREDRQIAAKKDAEIAELAEKFAKQVEGFEAIGVRLRQELIAAIGEVLVELREEAITDVKKEARAAVDAIVENLTDAVKSTERVLHNSQKVVTEQSRSRTVSIWAAALAAGILTGVFIAWWIMPAPTLPLTNQQVLALRDGIILDRAWSKMTKAEQERIGELADEAAKEQGGAGQEE